MSNIKISIGILACNEEANIKLLLEDILGQKEERFYIEEIIVISDGSTDRTADFAQSVKDKRIKVISHNDRIGKPARSNELFDLFKGDVLIRLDADVKFYDESVIKKLVYPFILDNKTAIVCGNQKPWPPKKYTEKISHFGLQVWAEAVSRVKDHSDKYYCTGRIMAFSKLFLESFRFPPSQGSSEDMYIFYFAKTKGLKVAIAKDAIIYFKLPATFKDYFKQMSRFMNSEGLIRNQFDEKVINEHETITGLIKAWALLKKSVTSPPQIVLGFVIMQILARYFASSHENPAWDTSVTTKNFHS